MDDPGDPWESFKKCLKENIMYCHTSSPSALRRLCHAARALALLISLAALPAFGQQIHQLSYNGSNWADQNLNGAAAQQWAISAFFTTPNDQLHVFYGSLDSADLHQLYYNGSNWADEDLNEAVGLYQYSGISGFSVDNFQYVFYIGSDGDVHQMLYNGGWGDTDVTLASGTSAISYSGSNLVAFTTSPALHVYYTSTDSHVHQLFATNGTNWQDQDLTTTTNGPNANVAYGMAGFNVGNFQYVYYLDNATNHLHQLFYNNASWSDEDLTALTKSSPTAEFSNVSAFLIPGTKKMRVYFVSGKNRHIMQLASTNNGKWSSSDVTKKAKASVPDEQIVAFPDASGGKVNVYYVAGHDINRIYQPTVTTWANQDLTALTNGGVADSIDQLAGFSLNNNQYLYYVAD
jgi:hypothetical protein